MKIARAVRNSAVRRQTGCAVVKHSKTANHLERTGATARPEAEYIFQAFSKPIIGFPNQTPHNGVEVVTVWRTCTCDVRACLRNLLHYTETRKRNKSARGTVKFRKRTQLTVAELEPSYRKQLADAPHMQK